MLLDEINEKTEFHLKIQMWNDRSKYVTRISVNKKILPIEKVIRDVQLLGLDEGKFVDAKKIQKTIENLFVIP
jgi:hypothetical protein